MSPGARDVTNEDATAGRSPTGSGAKSTLARYVATPLRSASKVASALVGGFFFAAPETEEKDARAAGEAAQARAARGREAATGGAARRLLVEDENAGARTTRVGVDVVDVGVERARPMSSVPASMTTTTGTDSPTPFTEIKEFLRRGQMDRERMTRPVMASAVKPVSPFERAPAFEANVTPVRERAATAPAVTPSAGSPGYASMRRSYVAQGTPSLLGARGRTTVPKPAILEPQVEAAALTPTRMSLKREREVTFLDLERERARNTTPRRLESSAGPGAEARAPEYGSPAYQTPTAKTVTSAVTTDTAKRILQTLDRLASTRTATPLGGSTAGRTPGFAARPTPRAQPPSPVGSAFGNDASATKLTPTSATFVQTPKSGVSFAASPMPFVSSSASGRAPPTPYPTSAGEEYEEEIEARVFDFGTDEVRYSKGHKAPAGPVASVSVNFQFGADDKKGVPTPGPEKTKLTFNKPTPAKVPAPAFTATPPVAANNEAPKADKPVVNLWSADFLAKNQEHQKKVQAAIEEEEGAGAAAPAKPSPFAPAPAAGDKPAFSFGIPAAGASSAASSGAAFSFGSTAPAPAASTGAAPFSFGATAPAKPAEPAKPAGESGLLAFLGGSSQGKAADAPAVAPTFTFGAPPKSPDNVPVKAPEPAPAFTFGGSVATTEVAKPASGGFTFGGAASTAATTSTTAAPFSFGAKPAEKAPEVSAPKSELSASAPAFTFGSKVEATPASTPAPAAPFSFGSANAGDAAAKPAAFTFGATAEKASDKKENSEAAKPAAAGFSFGGASAPAFGTSTGASSDNKPQSAPAFSFGASAQASSGAASGGFSFGASAPAASVAASSGGGFVFGASSDAGKPASANPFGGGLSVNTTPATSVFGNAPKADEQPNTPEPMSPFETSKSPTSAGASLFGGAAPSAFPASTAPSARPVGGSSSFGASTGANPFGGASATPAFGAPAAPVIGGSNPFGSTSAAAPAFGGVAANPFGASTAPAANPFGANPPPSGGFSMGGGDAAAGQGGRKPRKFKRPPKRN